MVLEKVKMHQATAHMHGRQHFPAAERQHTLVFGTQAQLRGFLGYF